MLRTGAIERVLAPLRGDVEVELDLCPVAMAAQTCHSLGLFDESHVAVQNFQRFCDVAMGCEREASAEKYPARRLLGIQQSLGNGNLDNIQCGEG